ncbi:MAG: hypothetical protein COA78_27095 [Blastopirellula sp.]|nr:MAG: hypothetical protein COA78_27095 [Blastopirellula sp.]
MALTVVKTNLAFFVLACIGTVADARTWTDISGKKLEADFVRVTSDDKLVLQGADQEFIVPLNRFIKEDQEHVKKLLLIKPATLPSGKSLPGKSLSGSKSSTRNLTEKRVWTSTEGGSVTAKFLRIHETRVVLMQGSKPWPIEFYELSKFDQEFLRKELDALGRSAEIPEKPILVDSASSSSSSSNPGTSSTALSPPPSSSSSYSPGSSFYPGGSVPSYRPPSSSYRPPGSSYRPPTRTYPPRSYTPPSRSTAGSSSNSSVPGTSSSDSNQIARNDPSAYKPRFSKPNLPRFEAPRYDTENLRNCSKCDGELPNHISAGDHCPHCNAYFAKPGESQRSSNSSDDSSGWDTSNIQISGRAIRWLILIGVTVFGAFIGFCRWLFRQS